MFLSFDPILKVSYTPKENQGNFSSLKLWLLFVLLEMGKECQSRFLDNSVASYQLSINQSNL